MSQHLVATVAVVARQNKQDQTIQHHVAAQLGSHGFSPHCFVDGDPKILDCNIVLLIGAVSSMRQTVRQLERHAKPKPKVAIWLFEPLPPPDMPIAHIKLAARLSPIHTGKRWMKPIMHLLSRPLDAVLGQQYVGEFSVSMLRFLIDNFALIERGQRKGWLNHIVTSTEQKRVYLAEHEITAQFLPIGQQPVFGEHQGLKRDIDVLFIGSLKNTHRQEQLKAMMSRLSRMGLTTYVPNEPIWGQARTQLVNRAKILLHIHNLKWDTPWMRWYLASANGAVVATSPLSVEYPLRPDIDYLSADADSLPDEIYALAIDENRRKKMVKSLQDRIAAKMTCARSVAELASHLHRLLNSGV